MSEYVAGGYAIVRIMDRFMENGKMMAVYREKEDLIDMIFGFLLALTPILQHYKGIGVNAGFTVLILLWPWAMLKLAMNYRELKPANIGIVLGLVVFMVYKEVIHGVSLFGLAYAVVMIVYFLAAACGGINLKKIVSAAAKIAMVASILICVQYVCYYILQFHLQLVPTQLLLPESEIWVAGAQTGVIGVTGHRGDLYRPSAFFLEPSHMYLYLFPQLMLVLLASGMDRNRLKKAVLFSVGILLTTSGMGLVTVVCAWLLFIAFYNPVDKSFAFKNFFRKQNLLLMLAFAVCAVIAIVTVPFVRAAVMRFLDTSSGGAIAGRTRRAFGLLATMSGTQWLVGVTANVSHIDFNLPGFVATLYKFGVVGVLLSYSGYVYTLIKVKAPYIWISALIIMLSLFTAHTHGSFYMLYFMLILIQGAREPEMKRALCLPCSFGGKRAKKTDA